MNIVTLKDWAQFLASRQLTADVRCVGDLWQVALWTRTGKKMAIGESTEIEGAIRDAAHEYETAVRK